MKAIVISQYGSPDALAYREVERPRLADHQVLVRVRATSVNYNTLLLVTGKPFLGRLMMGAPRRPKYRIPGNDIAGTVEAVGAQVTRFRPGDDVFGDTAEFGYGTFAEYAAVPEQALTLKPANCSFEEAAAVPEAALVALQALRSGDGLQPGQQVLISGASGGIGTFAVQLARHFGAEVTAVCSPRNVEFVRSLGAHHVIDYTREDFALGGPRYDRIVATIGYRPLRDYQRALRPGGTYVATGGSLKQVFEPMLLGPLLSRGQRLGTLSLKPNQELALIKELLEAGAIHAVIDRCYPLSEAAAALHYYDQGHARGKVVLSVETDATGSR